MWPRVSWKPNRSYELTQMPRERLFPWHLYKLWNPRGFLLLIPVGPPMAPSGSAAPSLAGRGRNGPLLFSGDTHWQHNVSEAQEEGASFSMGWFSRLLWLYPSEGGRGTPSLLCGTDVWEVVSNDAMKNKGLIYYLRRTQLAPSSSLFGTILLVILGSLEMAKV